MMRRGTSAAVLAVGALVLLPAATAAAEPVVRPGGGGGGRVETVVTGPGRPPTDGAPPAGGVAPEQATAGGPAPCTYAPLTPQEALAAGLLSPDDGGVENLPDAGGVFVRRDCSASGGGRFVMWVPTADGVTAPLGTPAVTPEVLAEEARNSLQLPVPAVDVNPDGANQNPALVNLPTWWWVTNADPLTQRTAVATVWAEVSAEPVVTTWVAGDGTRTECPGLGLAWAPGMREDQPGSCRHTYLRADEAEQAEVQVVWRVSWVGSGGSGGTLEPLTMTMTTTLAVPVYERHAIVTSVG